MSSASEAQPVASAIPQVLLAAPRPRSPARRSILAILGRGLLGLLGWLWRWLAGAFLCLNTFTSILVTGWTYRWVQGLVLRGWWKQSRFRKEGSFDDFLAGLGPPAPVRKPRWLLQERIRASLTRPGPDGQPAGALHLTLRLLRAPWHSLWLNFKVGVKALVCTLLLTGWGCLLIYFGWTFGWLNSFNKGYEQAFVGPLVSLLGIALFALSLFYLPMAQIHQGVTGEARAFFDFRFVWRLIQARITAYCGVAALIVLASLPLEVLKIVVPNVLGNDESQPDAELRWQMGWALFGACLLLFPTLLLVRRVAARVYRSAVLRVLRRGTVTRDELHPALARWLDRLELLPVPVAATTGLGQAVWTGGRLGYRGLLYFLLFVIWLLFVAQTYAGEFFVRHTALGFLNRELLQLPTFDYMPADLRNAP
jgi:hypothetical protein